MNTPKRNRKPKKGDVWYEFMPFAEPDPGWARWKCLRVTKNGWYTWRLINGVGKNRGLTRKNQGYWGRISPNEGTAHRRCIMAAIADEANSRREFRECRQRSEKKLKLGADWIAAVDRVGLVIDRVLGSAVEIGVEQGRRLYH